MESKDLLTVCRQAGIDVKNQLSTLDPDQVVMIEQMVRKGKTAPPAATAQVTAPLQAPPPKIRNLHNRPPVLTPRPLREPEAGAPSPCSTPPPPGKPRPHAPRNHPQPRAPPNSPPNRLRSRRRRRAPHRPPRPRPGCATPTPNGRQPSAAVASRPGRSSRSK